MKIAQAPLAAAPSASAISTMPAAIATGKVPAWIHPRHVGLISAFALTSAASIRGSRGMSTPSSGVGSDTVRA